MSRTVSGFQRFGPWHRALSQQIGGAAPSCDITLDTDSAAGLGLQPAEISGQTFGKASSAAGTGYLASTDADTPTPLWGTGRRWIELHTYSLSGTDGSANIRAGFARLDTFVTFVMRATSGISDPLRRIQLLDAGGSVIAEVNPGSGTGPVALGVDSSGNCFYDIGDGPVRPGGAFDAAFAGANIALLGIATFTNAAESATMGIRTNGADYALPKFVSGDADWCGNALTLAAWTPDNALSGATNSFWADPLDGTLYQDASLTTPASSPGDVVGGVDNQSAIGTSTLSQTTTAKKFVVGPAGNLLAPLSSTNNDDRLAFGGLTINIANGFCVAAVITDIESNGLILGETLIRFYFAASGGVGLTLRVGGSTNRSVANVFNSLPARVIITGNAVDYSVYVNGVFRATFASEATTTVFSGLGLANRSTSSISSDALEYGRLLVAERDMRTGVAELDSWLGGSV